MLRWCWGEGTGRVRVQVVSGSPSGPAENPCEMYFRLLWVTHRFLLTPFGHILVLSKPALLPLLAHGETGGNVMCLQQAAVSEDSFTGLLSCHFFPLLLHISHLLHF